MVTYQCFTFEAVAFANNPKVECACTDIYLVCNCCVSKGLLFKSCHWLRLLRKIQRGIVSYSIIVNVAVWENTSTICFYVKQFQKPCFHDNTPVKCTLSNCVLFHVNWTRQEKYCSAVVFISVFRNSENSNPNHSSCCKAPSTPPRISSSDSDLFSYCSCDFS